VVAYSENGTGDLVVATIPSGERIATLAPSGSPGSLSVSPDRRQVAFAVEPEFVRHVFVADITAAAIREILPGTGGMMPSFQWGGDWFDYYIEAGGVFRTVVAEAGASVARSLGDDTVDVAGEIVSRTPPRIAYTECSSGSGFSCPRQLVVENVDGTDQAVIGMAPMIVPVAFTPDGQTVITYEQQADGEHLVARDANLGQPTDLGLADPLEVELPRPGGVSPISPDGTEVLTGRNGLLMAVRIDGTGARMIADALPTRAGFTSRGDVLCETVRDLSTTDVGDLRYDLQLYSDGDLVDLWLDQQQCQTPWFASPDGEYVAWSCWDTLSVFHLPDGAIARTGPPAVSILGYDRLDEGLVTAEFTPTSLIYSLYYTTHDGIRTAIGEAWYLDTPLGNVEWPPFSFAP